MIPQYSDHAANERTFLAWIRTGVAVIAFGFVVEKFNLFLVVVAGTASADAAKRLSLDRLAGPLGHYDGIALIVVGVSLILFAAVRFFRTARLIDDPEPHRASDTRVEVMISAVLAVAAAAVAVYLVLG